MKNRSEKMIDLIVKEFCKSTFPEDYILYQILCNGLNEVAEYYAMQSLTDLEECDIQFDKDQVNRTVNLLRKIKKAYYYGWDDDE